MVEILVRGTPYNERWMAVICHRCLSTLKFQGKEVKEGAAGTVYIKCPVCPADDNWVGADKAKPV